MPQTVQIGKTCILCNEAITNPVCVECLTREVEYWLLDKNPRLVGTVKDYSKSFREFTHIGNRCVVCGRNMNVCAHCYTQEIRGLLKEKCPKLVSEFIKSFNFELDYKFGMLGEKHKK